MTPKATHPELTSYFVDAFCHSGSCMGTCDCGVFYYDSDGQWDFGEGELERHQADPKAVDSPVHQIEVGGRTFVVGCPCNGAGQYETFIWGHRFDIASYLNARSQQEAKNATTDAEQMATTVESRADDERLALKAAQQETRTQTVQPGDYSVQVARNAIKLARSAVAAETLRDL